MFRLTALALAVACHWAAAEEVARPPALADSAPQFIPPELPSGYTPKAIRHANRDMVSAANPHAAQAGAQILAQGGNAVDAAIAVQMVLNLVEPQSSGIGGGAFMLVYDKATARLLAYDGRETAPAAATPDMFLGKDGKPRSFSSILDGGLSVGTPGVLRMLEMVHDKHGRLPWAALFAPAIRLCEDGFPMSDRLHQLVAGALGRIQAQGEPVTAYFLTAAGEPKPAGTLLKNPALAATFKAIAAGGADAFYQGRIARDIVAKVASHPVNPGRLAESDLRAYAPKVREPVCGVYRIRYRICGMPPPSSGGIAILQTLGILEHFDVGSLKPDSADAVHIVSDAYRLAFADRGAYLADPDFVPVPTAGLLDRTYLKQRAGLLGMQSSIGVPVAGKPTGTHARLGRDNSLDLPSTTHVSVIDGSGNAVAMTTSIENAFGSLQMVDGFLLNNQMTDFSFAPVDAAGRPVANSIAPLKRPRSAMAPTVIFDAQTGDLEAVLGSPGGPVIIQYVTKAIVGMIDWKLDVQQAFNLPNFGAQTNAVTYLEKGSLIDTPAIAEALRARGHVVTPTTGLTSGLNGVVFNGLRADGRPGLLARNPAAGRYAGGADPRREGTSIGND